MTNSPELIIVLLVMTLPGLHIVNAEWHNLWSRGKLIGLGRVFVLLLPFLVAVNLILIR